MIITYIIIALLVWIASKYLLWRVRDERAAIRRAALLYFLLFIGFLAFMTIFLNISFSQILKWNSPFFQLLALFISDPSRNLFVLGFTTIIVFGFIFVPLLYKRRIGAFIYAYFSVVLGYVILFPPLFVSLGAYVHLAEHSVIGMEIFYFYLYYPLIALVGLLDVFLSGEIIKKKRKLLQKD